MPDIYLDVDVALAEVPVNIMPLIDDTDFKTIEGAVAYNAAGMALRWHFVTSAGAYTVTSVTPTTAGNYDWTDQGDSGIYTIEIPASGGASINNDTEGYGWFTGVATGVLPWRGPIIGFRAAAINDALCDGGDLLDVSVTQFAGDAQSATDLKDFADAGYDPATNKVQGVLLTDTLTTYTGNTVQTGDSFARIGATGSGLTSLATQASVNTIDGIVDDILVDTAVIGAAGAGLTALATQASVNTIDGIVDDILVDTAVIGAAGAGLTAIPWNASWDAEVQSEVADALAVYDPPTNAEMESRTLVSASYATAAALATVDTVVDSILVDTAEIGVAGAGLTALATQASIDAVPTAIENADAILSRNVSNVEATCPEHCLASIVLACLEYTISGATWIIQRTDGSTTHLAKTLTTNASAEPVTAVE